MAKVLPIAEWIAESMADHMPGFEQLVAQKPGHWFRRSPSPHRYSIIIIQSSQKHRALGVDVVSTFLPTWDRQYGHHQMIASTSVPNLRVGSSSIPTEQAFYPHDGTEASVRATLAQICGELATFAMPFFEECERASATDPLLRAGLDWLRARADSLPKPLFLEQEKVLLGRKCQVRIAQGTVLEELKSFLRQECTRIGASKWQRKETAILGLHLLDYAQAGLLGGGSLSIN